MIPAIEITELSPDTELTPTELWETVHEHGVHIEHFPVPVLYQRLHPDAITPSHGQVGDAGADYFALEDTVVPARGRALVKTGIAIAIPAGYYGKLQSRSGLSLKQGIEVGAGVIDNSYRKAVGVVLYNHTDEDFLAEKGKAVAQMTVLAYERQSYVEVAELPPSDRTEGWGSSGR